MAVAGFVVCLLLMTNAHTLSQYTDDSDYKDLELYEAPAGYNFNRDQDDFYILANFEDNDIYARKNDMEDSLAKRSPVAKLDWYKPEKVYRYTKHRIPGYDYEELDYVISRNFQQCDGRSVWTHCLCQFTCAEPDVVDCYSPCKSGCECKEEYVYDEKSRQCLPPDQCPLRDDVYVG